MNKMVNQILESREMSSFYLSVGTGLMLETLFEPITPRIDDDRIINNIKVNDYKIHYFNIHTLIRNIIQSIKGTELKKFVLKSKDGPSSVVDILINELEIMKELYGNTTCKLVLFIPTYKTYYSKIGNIIKPNDMNTAKLDMYHFIDTTIKFFHMSNYNAIDILKTDHKLLDVNGKILLTTHNTIDLLNVKKVRRLFLLESHTGKLKDFTEFNSKYHAIGKRDLTHLPFNEKLLYIFGDKSMLTPLSIRIRVALYEIAIKNRWTQFTTDSKIESGLKELNRLFPDMSDIKKVF